MNIGSLHLKNNVFLAPMAGITDLPFRTVVRSFGCGLAFTEMVSGSGLIRGKGKTFQELADEAFKDLLKKHHQPVGLKAALKESVGGKGKPRP